MLKGCLGYKKHQWALFNSKIKDMVKQQQQEMEKAIIGYGQYQLRPQFSSLAVTDDKCFRMTQEQRQRCIRKFNAATVHHMTGSEESTTATPMSTAANTSSSADILSLSGPSSSTGHDITVGRRLSPTTNTTLSLGHLLLILCFRSPSRIALLHHLNLVIIVMSCLIFHYFLYLKIFVMFSCQLFS